MSGRSAYVRKEKTKVKDSGASHEGSSDRNPYDDENFYPNNNENSTIKSSGSDDQAWQARVRKPHVPVIDVSGIEKSTFRSMMDKKSESVRKGLVKTFGKKKKGSDNDGRPLTAATYRYDSHELDSGDYIPAQAMVKNRQQQPSQPESVRPGPPQTQLPPIPQGPPLKRWVGEGRAPQPWNKLRKDPELWDPHGDTLVFFGHDTRQTSRPLPSFRVLSHAIEATESHFLVSLLREGSTEDINSFGMPPSPVGSPTMSSIQPSRQGRLQHTPPMSEADPGSYDGLHGQISYEIYFPAPGNLNRTDVMRHQVTTRNVFAVLYQASLVGLSLYQSLSDLTERLEVYMPAEVDAAGMVIEYLINKRLDDVRENPAAAVALLAWSELKGVRWEEGYREAFIHCAGMFSQLEATPDFRFVSQVTKAYLERSSLKTAVRVESAEQRLAEFDFKDMWIVNPVANSPSRAAFDRLQKFFLQYYKNSYEAWPPAAPQGHDEWLTRNLTKKLQTDFGALYDFIVNRDAKWDGSEERSGRKWNIVMKGNPNFNPDDEYCKMTDILIAFDNKNKYPHIPNPYPLTPELSPQRTDSLENLAKAKKSAKVQEDKMAEKKAALAYTESTNIYLLGSDFVNNDLVEAFVKFEKSDRPGDLDPYASRRGRWVLIYGILQTLASLSVDTPNMRYQQDVSYHISPELRGTPPWQGANPNNPEANHNLSHCWTVRANWNIQEAQPISKRRKPQLSIRSSTVQSSASSDAGTVESSVRSPSETASSRGHVHVANSSTKSRRSSRKSPEAGQFMAYNAGGIDQWPIKEETGPERMESSPQRNPEFMPRGLQINDYTRLQTAEFHARAQDKFPRSRTTEFRREDRREKTRPEVNLDDFPERDQIGDFLPRDQNINDFHQDEPRGQTKEFKIRDFDKFDEYNF